MENITRKSGENFYKRMGTAKNNHLNNSSTGSQFYLQGNKSETYQTLIQMLKSDLIKIQDMINTNSGDIKMYNQEKTILTKNTKFHFSTFGFPIEAEIIEFVPPENGKEGRIAWHGWAEGDAEKRLDVIHAWLVED